MAAESWKNCLEEELICPICLHVFIEPIQLSCKHNFCRGCISEAWAKDTPTYHCPECNHDFNQKPALEKNIKLTNIVEKFNSLNIEKTETVLYCILCRRGPPTPAQKVCLRCNAPCCLSHVQTHLQQASPAPGHLMVDAQDVQAWSCPQHNEYRLYHCEAEQVAVCQYCYFSRCASSHGHTVCDVEVKRNDVRHMLRKQQVRLDDRVEDIEEQLCKLESDKSLVEDAVCELKEQVRSQYQRMQALLEEDLSETMQIVDRAHSRYRQENTQQALQLGERRQAADKLLSSVQMVFHRADHINFMKNTKPIKLLMDRCQLYMGSGLSPYRVGHLNCKLLLSEVTKKEKNLCKILEVPLSAPSLLQTIPSVSGANDSGRSSRPEKRKQTSALPETDTGTPSKQSYLGSIHHEPSSSTEGLSSQAGNPGMPPCNAAQSLVGLAASSSGPSTPQTTVFPAQYPAGGPSQQGVLPPQYGGRKILMCTIDNCFCSGVPSRSHPPYAQSGSFPWGSSQEFPAHHSLGSEGLSVRDWIDTQHTHAHTDFYGLYGQSSAKHYVTR
ncbi:hypothetical protein UPYG_G00320690 [Umbra pygmaea]|uniref:E3 ubiquitin-protein ligase TRIM8 n=1 Tax=Umbra pygmaea TaxID=75934 RepID=A0ABD0W4X2_UMBPY